MHVFRCRRSNFAITPKRVYRISNNMYKNRRTRSVCRIYSRFVKTRTMCWTQNKSAAKDRSTRNYWNVYAFNISTMITVYLPSIRYSDVAYSYQHLSYMQRSQQCNRIAITSGSLSHRYRVTQQRWGVTFNTNMRV